MVEVLGCPFVHFGCAARLVHAASDAHLVSVHQVGLDLKGLVSIFRGPILVQIRAGARLVDPYIRVISPQLLLHGD